MKETHFQRASPLCAQREMPPHGSQLGFGPAGQLLCTQPASGGRVSKQNHLHSSQKCNATGSGLGLPLPQDSEGVVTELHGQEMGFLLW